MSQLRIVACGGGDLTTGSRRLFEAGLNLTGASKPKVLVIPTVSTDHLSHAGFQHRLRALAADWGVAVRVLRALGKPYTTEEMAEHVDWADAVCIPAGAGSRTQTLQEWTASGLTDLLAPAVKAGEVVVIGVREGATMWFSQAYDEQGFPQGVPVFHKGLGIVEAALCTHADRRYPKWYRTTDTTRIDAFRRLLTQELPIGCVGIALDTDIGMQIAGNEVTVLSTDQPGHAGQLRYFRILGNNYVSEAKIGPSTRPHPLEAFVRRAPSGS